MDFASVDLNGILGELIGMLSVAGGIGLGGYAIYAGSKERLQRLETISKERLVLIEKGMDPALAYQKPDNNQGAKPLLWGLIFAGAGLGLLLGSQIGHLLGVEADKVTVSSAILFGGLGMVIYYFYYNKRNAQKAG